MYICASKTEIEIPAICKAEHLLLKSIYEGRPAFIHQLLPAGFEADLQRTSGQKTPQKILYCRDPFSTRPGRQGYPARNQGSFDPLVCPAQPGSTQNQDRSESRQTLENRSVTFRFDATILRK